MGYYIQKKGVLVSTNLKAQEDYLFLGALRDLLEVSIAEAFLRGIKKCEFTKLIEEKYNEFEGGIS